MSDESNDDPTPREDGIPEKAVEDAARVPSSEGDSPAETPETPAAGVLSGAADGEPSGSAGSERDDVAVNAPDAGEADEDADRAHEASDSVASDPDSDFIPLLEARTETNGGKATRIEFAPFVPKLPEDVPLALPADRLEDLREIGLLVIACASDEVLEIAVSKVEATYPGTTVSWPPDRLSAAHVAAAPTDEDGSDEPPRQRHGFQSVLDALVAEGHRNAVLHVRDRELLESVRDHCMRDPEGALTRMIVAVHTSTIRLDDSIPKKFLWKPDDLEALLRLAYRQWEKSPRRDTSESVTLPHETAQTIEELYEHEREALFDRDHIVRKWLKNGYGYLVAQLRLAQAKDGVGRVQGGEAPEWSRSSICRTIHFLMNSISPLTPRVFERLLEVLLESEEEEWEEEDSVETEDGIVKRRVPKSQNAWEHWRSKEDHFLDLCGIEESFGSPKTYVYQDEQQGAGVSVYLRWRHSRFRRRQFEKLLASRILFDPEQSPGVVSRLIELAAEMARDYPEDYGDLWLANMLIEIEQDRHVSLGTAAALAKSISAYVSRLQQVYGRTRFFYQRLADLCAELLLKESTSTAVHSLLRGLRSAQADGAEVLWRLSVHLRGRDGFSFLDQTEHILQDAGFGSRVAVVKGLVQDVLEDELRRGRVLERIGSWMPAPEEAVVKMQGLYALGFLWQLTETALESPRTERVLVEVLFGRTPRPGPKLVDWLLHPKLDEGVKRLLRDRASAGNDKSASRRIEALDAPHVIADLLETWHELAGRSEIADAREGLSEFIGTVRREVDLPSRRAILKIWAFRASRALDRMRPSGSADPERRSYWRARRARLRELQAMLSINKPKQMKRETK